MERRDVLKLGALATVGGSGCAGLLANPASVGAGEMGGFLSALDGALAAITARKNFDRFLPTTQNAELTARVKYSEELTKKTVRSLLLVGTVQELEPEQLAHEGVQQRLRDSMGEFDDAMFGMTEMMEGLSPSDRATVAKALRDDPNLGMRIMGMVDEDAAAFGVSLKQRTKLRAISAQACARLRQSPDLAIAEYTGKMHKVAARHGARAEAERRAAAAVGASLLWQGQEGGIDTSAFKPVTGGEFPDAGLTPPPVFSTPSEEQVAPPKKRPPLSDREDSCATSKECRPGLVCQDYRHLGDGKWTKGVCKPEPKKVKSSPGILTAGGIVLGLAATGALIVGASAGWVYGATVGAVVGAIGIVILIIGLIVLATGH